MRNMSFSLTTPQFKADEKDVTRRFGWWKLKPGEHVMAVEKAMGLKKGEKMVTLGIIEIVSVRTEAVCQITQADVVREGFPTWTPEQFIELLIKSKKGADRFTLVNRIEFKKVRP